MPAWHRASNKFPNLQKVLNGFLVAPCEWLFEFLVAWEGACFSETTSVDVTFLDFLFNGHLSLQHHNFAHTGLVQA